MSAVEQVRPAAIVRLRVRSRDHREFGTLWRYVGFDCCRRRTQRQPHVGALPEFVHGVVLMGWLTKPSYADWVLS